MEKFCLVVFNFLLLSLCSACSQRKEIQTQVTKMNHQYVVLNIDSMQQVIPFPSENFDSIDAEFTFVVYTDSNQCSGCSLNKMSRWNSYLRLEKQTHGKVKYVFIVEPQSGDAQSVLRTAKLIDFVHPLYIDTSHVFRNSNSFIPKDPMYHTFLVDKGNRIVLVGNPLLNNRIEKLALSLIEEKIGQISY